MILCFKEKLQKCVVCVLNLNISSFVKIGKIRGLSGIDLTNVECRINQSEWIRIKIKGIYYSIPQIVGDFLQQYSKFLK